PLVDHHEIAVLDVVVDHRLAMHAQDKIVRTAEKVLELETLFLCDRLGRRAGGDATEKRQTARLRPDIKELNRTCRKTFPLDQASTPVNVNLSILYNSTEGKLFSRYFRRLGRVQIGNPGPQRRRRECRHADRGRIPTAVVCRNYGRLTGSP